MAVIEGLHIGKQIFIEGVVKMLVNCILPWAFIGSPQGPDPHTWKSALSYWAKH